MKHWVWILAALCAGANAQAQNTGRITGKVTGDGGLPVALAQVSVLGASRSAVTDSNGTYLIVEVPAGTVRVQARRIGYTPVTVQVNVRAGATANADFALSSAAVQLEGLVVVAYGEQERRDVTGSISSVNVDLLRDVPLPSPAQLLQGRVPGVDVVAGGSYRPGAPMQVRIRGVRSMTASNEPLYVVDGVPVQGGIQDFDPGTIASIEVLKDASATAPYGSAGANGVIMVTTKRGTEGGSRFTYDAQYGTQHELRLANLMGPRELAAERIEANRSAGRDTSLAGVFNTDQLPQARCLLDPAYKTANPTCSTGTDWQQLIKRLGNQQRHQIGYTSASGASRLSLTGTYFDQNGITQGQGYNQYSGTVSFENTYGRLRMGITASGSRSSADLGGDASVWGEAFVNDVLGLPYLDTLGNATAVNCKGCTLKLKPTNDPLRVNPLRQEQGFVRQQLRNRLFASVFAELQLGYGFSYRINFGPDLSNRSDGQFQGANVVAPGGQAIGNAQAQLQTEEDFRYTLDNLLNWNYNAGDHKIQATALYSVVKDRYSTSTASARNLPYDYQLWYNLGTGDAPQPPVSALSVFTTLSYMGRVNYTYANRYSLTVTGRYDGSSVLAPGNKWSFFPSAGVSWQVGDEPFMRHVPFVSSLKLRASLGTTGNSSINPYQTEGSLSRTLYNFGTSSAAGYVPGSIPNPDLQWERTAQRDLGLDFGFLNNRISGTLDLYRETTDRLLLSRQLPASTGFTSTLQNIGKTGNAGWEFSLSTVNLPGTTGGLRWTTDINLTHNENYIISLAGGVGDDLGNRWFIGQPINVGGGGTGGATSQGTGADALHNVFYDYKFVGIWQLADSALARSYGQKPGDIRVADLNGDGKIDAADRVIRGNTYPKMIASIFNRISLGRFDLSFLVQGRLGYTLLDGFAAGDKLFERYNFVNAAYWTPAKCAGPAGATAAQQAAIPGCSNMPNPSAGRENPLYNDLNFCVVCYRDGSHWRVRNITLGFTLPESITRRIRGVSSVRIYAEAQDPFVITSYYGIDPESGNSTTPPSYRTLLIGATFGF
jgi:TonB-linked SusC/RagA family outer membrane protein